MKFTSTFDIPCSKFVIQFCISLALISSLVFGNPPASKGVPVKNVYHGVTVVDEYQWLEDWSDPAVRKWSDEQNAHARSILDKLPNVDAIRKSVTQIMSAETTSFGGVSSQTGKIFAIKRQPPKQQPFLVVMDSFNEPSLARVLVDPNSIDDQGATSIDWYVPSTSGELVAVSLSKSGTESGDVHVYETSTGREVFEMVPRVNGGTAGGDLAWLPDDSGFFYTRYPRGEERPGEDMDFFQQVYLHKLGTATTDDTYQLGEDLPRIAEIELQIEPKSGRLLVTVQNGDGGEFAHYLRSPDGKWRQFSRFDDEIVQATFGVNDDLYLVTHDAAPRGKILRMPINSLDVSKSKTVVPQTDDTIVTSFHGRPTVLPTATRLYVTYQLGGPSEIRVFDHDGKRQNGPRQVDVSSVGGLTRLVGDDILFENESFVQPGAYYCFDSKSGATNKTKLANDSPVDLSDATVVREFATSKDGTKVPLNIILPPGVKRDGSNPCLVTGYGGYGISVSPRFKATLRILLDQGFVFAVANLRGGGEYGDDWHRQGNLTKKQNVFDDFAGVLRHMIERRYTSSNKLAIQGGSNGGLLMGATLTQNPSLMNCVISHVGIYDMLRVELAPNGSFNVPEFGTVKDADQFHALHAYSPFHRVEDDTKYPPTLFLTGANDPRVDPMHSRKMTARLQAAGETTVLLRTSANSGHGGGTALAEQIEQSVDVYAFLFDQLGIEFQLSKE